MATICIAGASLPDLQHVSTVLQRAGMALLGSKDGSGTMDMAAWHDLVCLEACGKLDPGQVVSSPGRELVRQAMDLFGPGMQARVTGWSDTRCIWLLDFWANLEPRLLFLLVCTSPQDALERALTLEQDDFSVDQLMAGWQARHEQLLHFHHVNPERSLLVDGRESVEFADALIEHCARKWQLPLSRQSIAEPPLPTGDVLCRFTAQQLCRRYPLVTELQHELVATRANLGGAGSPALPANDGTDPGAVVAAVRQLRQSAAAAESVPILKSKFDSVRIELEMLRDSTTQQGQLTEQRLQAACRENEFLLAQLIQLQEELEDSQAANLAKATAIDTAVTNLVHAERENVLQAQQMRQVQDELQRYFHQYQDSQRQLNAAASRWRRLLEHKPDYFDHAALEIVGVRDTPDKAIGWRLTSFEAAGRSLPELQFDTVIVQGVAGIALHRQTGSASPLFRWPACLADGDEALILPLDDALAEREVRRQVLDELATSDWAFVQVLVKAFAKALRPPGDLSMPVGMDRTALLAAVDQLQQRLDRLPAVFRYDHVVLKREQVNPDYEHLWFRFENLSFAGRHWTEFEFRLSCADVRPDHFGFCPKLEFPKDASEAPFEAWFVEATDDFGAKLELRFALPDSMDLAVWQRLSERDRDFLSALIERLPAILAVLQAEGVSLQRPWGDWMRMVTDMQAIVSRRAVTRRTGPRRVVQAVARTLHRVVFSRSGPGRAGAPEREQTSISVGRN